MLSRNRRGSVLILSLVVVVMLSMIGLALMELSNAANLREYYRYRSAQAAWRNYGACNYAAWQLYSTDQGSINEGQSNPNPAYSWGMDGATLAYPLVGEPGGDASTVEILVTAPSSSRPRMRAIRAENTVMNRTDVVRSVIDLSPPNPYLGYAILSDDTISVSGNATVQSTPAVWPTVFNANVHGNGLFVTVWGSATVKGFVSAVGQAQIKPGSVTPVVNPDNLPPFYDHIDPIDVPDLDPATLVSKADLVFAPSAVPSVGGDTKNPLVISNWVGSWGGGAANDPSMVFINGNWKPKGSFVIQGHVILVVNGDFAPVSGNFVFGAASGGSLTIIARSINIEGNAVITASLYAYQNFAFDGKGGAQLNGSIIANGKVDLNGTVDLNFVRLDDAMWPEPAVPKQLSYQTRQPGQTW